MIHLSMTQVERLKVVKMEHNVLPDQKEIVMLRRLKEIYLSSTLKDHERRTQIYDECIKQWQKELSPEELERRWE